MCVNCHYLIWAAQLCICIYSSLQTVNFLEVNTTHSLLNAYYKLDLRAGYYYVLM